ncbi:PhoH family protein, partial [Gilvimarinus sp. 1_MG-2023]
VSLLETGYHTYADSFWDSQTQVNSFHDATGTFHRIPRGHLPDELYLNHFILDESGFVGKVVDLDNDMAVLHDLPVEQLMSQVAWGLRPRDLPQALALHLLLDPSVSLVTLSGQAGSGKTILALAAAIEMTVATQQFRRIIATRST